MICAGETQRLILNPLEMADAEQIQNLFGHWEIVRYLAVRVPWPYPPDGAVQYCRDVALPEMERGEGWHWTIRLAVAPTSVIGMISLEMDESGNRGFWLGIPWQGKGFMSEACIWVNDFWFETLGFDRLRAPKAAPNLASRRISEKQGMRLVGVEERDYVCGRLKTEIWEITAAEWRAWKAARHISKLAEEATARTAREQ